MKKNQKVMVSVQAPFHAERIGYFQFFSGDSVVLSDDPIYNKEESGVYFAVDIRHMKLDLDGVDA